MAGGVVLHTSRTRELLAQLTYALCVPCPPQSAELLKQAKTKYTAKDLMGALKLYEDVLAQVCTGQLWRECRA